MRRMFLGLALAVLAMGPPSQVRAGDAEDREAAQEIAGILRDSGKIRDYNVGVKYKKGTVWLEGRVTTEEQMQEVLMLVGDLDEVTQIVNNLSVGPAGPMQKTRSGKKVQITRGNAGNPARQRGQPSASDARVACRWAWPRAAVLPLRPIISKAIRIARQARCRAKCQGQMGGGGMGGGPMGGQVPAQMGGPGAGGAGRPLPAYVPGPNGSPPPAAYDQPYMPNYAWPSYAAYPNYAAVTYPKQYAASAWPYIGPFHPYPQVPLGWRKVSLEWDDGWWFLDFDDRGCH